MNDGPLFTRYERRDGRRLGIIFVLAIASIVVGSIIYNYMTYVANYATRPTRLTDAVRIESMSARMNQAYQALLTAEQRVYADKQAIDDFLSTYGTDASTYPQGKRAELDQLRVNHRNSVSQYNSLCGQYMAVYADEFQEIAAPPDLPTQCARFS